MADIEKVIRGWERCRKSTCPSIFSKEYKECEYTDGLYCRKDRLIDETLELLKNQNGLLKALEQSNAVNEYLNNQIAEQPQIVRCRDCKYKEMSVSPYWDVWCSRLHCGCDFDWFCADGERR